MRRLPDITALVALGWIERQRERERIREARKIRYSLSNAQELPLYAPCNPASPLNHDLEEDLENEG
jgi:hypothetical protein